MVRWRRADPLLLVSPISVPGDTPARGYPPNNNGTAARSSGPWPAETGGVGSLAQTVPTADELERLRVSVLSVSIPFFAVLAFHDCGSHFRLIQIHRRGLRLACIIPLSQQSLNPLSILLDLSCQKNQLDWGVVTQPVLGMRRLRVAW